MSGFLISFLLSIAAVALAAAIFAFFDASAALPRRLVDSLTGAVALPILILLPSLFYVLEPIPDKWCRGCKRHDVGYTRPGNEYCADCHRNRIGVEHDLKPFIFTVNWLRILKALAIMAFSLWILLLLVLPVQQEKIWLVLLMATTLVFSAGFVLVAAISIIDWKFWRWLFRRFTDSGTRSLDV